MAELNLRPCQKCNGAAELKEGVRGYYVECENGCCYTPIMPNKISAVNQWNVKRVVVRGFIPVFKTEGVGNWKTQFQQKPIPYEETYRCKKCKGSGLNDRGMICEKCGGSGVYDEQKERLRR